MWGDELEIESALRGDVPEHIGRARVFAGLAVLVAVAIVAFAGVLIAHLG